MTTLTQQQVGAIVQEAMTAAAETTQDWLNKHGDRDACGFAWTTVYGVKGSTKLGKMLLASGFNKSYDGGLQMWNPSKNFTQCITAKEEGAGAAARILKARLGVQAIAGSRMD